MSKFFRHNLRLRFINRMGPDGRELYMVRLYLLGGWMINWIRLTDLGPLHNHPSETCKSLVLLGWYDEQYLSGNGLVAFVRHTAGSYRAFPGRRYHKITRLPAWGCLTLFQMGSRETSWGFRVNGRHVDHVLYKQSVGL